MKRSNTTRDASILFLCSADRWWEFFMNRDEMCSFWFDFEWFTCCWLNRKFCSIRCCNLIDLKVCFQRKDYLEADLGWPGSRVDRHHPVEDFYFICKNVSAWKHALKSRKRCHNLFMQNIQLPFIVDVVKQWRNFFIQTKKVPNIFLIDF